MSEPDDSPNNNEGNQNVEQRGEASPDSDEVLLGELLDDLPPDKAEKVLEVIATRYSGPIPPPELLKQFDEIVEGAAKQILDDAHAEHQHRRDMEKSTFEATYDMDKRQLKAAVWESRLGQICIRYRSRSDRWRRIPCGHRSCRSRISNSHNKFSGIGCLVCAFSTARRRSRCAEVTAPGRFQ